jgi:hypothetical protein
MSTHGDWPADPDDRSSQRDPWEEPPARRPGMSTGAKVLIVLLSIAGLALLLCCGVGLWIWSTGTFEVVETPEAAIETTQEIVSIEIPELFQPKQSMSMGLLGFGFEMAIYETQDGEGGLVIGEMKGVPAGNAQPEMQMRQALRRQDGQGELKVNKTETREFEVRGQKVRFEFAEAVDDAGNEFRTVSGAFSTADGQGFLLLQMPAESYDEDAVVKMIESIE